MLECTHCNGFGSSFKDPGDERCSKCGGSGLAPEPACYVSAPKLTKESDKDLLLDEQAKQGMAEMQAECINDRVMSGFYYGGSE